MREAGSQPPARYLKGERTMKVKEFMKLSGDIDVYDDVCEAVAICFCAPQGLTEEGEKHFAEVLNYEMTLDLSGSIPTAIVHVDDDDEKVWKHKLKKAKEFFYSAAGYCAANDYDKWFIDPDDNVLRTSLLL